ncbi:helix-hairpin-helix domain-containing protein, partial [candidate division KSB1 bacterium]|nr:helix-hairpin-helix domain-containing protein [candidate division KSB1 bacterium]
MPYFKLLIYLTCVFGFLLNISSAPAQEPNNEDYFDTQEETSEATEIIELLEHLKKHPIDLNKASRDELLQIAFLLPVQVDQILQYRKTAGLFTDILELYHIPELSTETIDMIRPYLTISTVPPINLTFNSRIRIKGLLSSKQDKLVSPLKIYQRYHISTGEKVNAWILLEKDPGEKPLNDFQSAAFVIDNFLQNSKLLIGNYNVKIAQGLILSGPYGQALAADPLSPLQNHSRIIQPYRSVNENSALHGLAWQFEKASSKYLFFISNAKRDANLTPDGEITSLYDSGIHQTPSELKKKQRTTEQLYGATFSSSFFKKILIGMTFLASHFEHPFVSLEPERKRFAFQGRDNQFYGFDFNILQAPLSLSGEIAWQKSGHHAITTGIVISQRGLQALLFYRNYSPQFYSIHGRAWGNFMSIPKNEEGFYAGLKYRLTKNTKLSAYLNFSRTPWRTYFEKMPVESRKSRLQITHQLNKSCHFVLSTHMGEETQGYSYSNQYHLNRTVLLSNRYYHLRFQMDFKLLPYLKFRMRFEKKWAKMPEDNLLITNILPKFNTGTLIYHQLQGNIKPTTDFQIRFYLFHISEYPARLYAYEADIPGIMTNFLFQDQGYRWYFSGRYHWQRQ